MIYRVQDAIQEALNQIQELGYVVISAHDDEHIEIIWPHDSEPPEIDQLLSILKIDYKTLESILVRHTVAIPLWIIHGYPWEHPLKYWKELYKTLPSGPQDLVSKKRAYVEACIAFYKDKQNQTWKQVRWEEPWPLAS